MAMASLRVKYPWVAVCAVVFAVVFVVVLHYLCPGGGVEVDRLPMNESGLPW